MAGPLAPLARTPGLSGSAAPPGQERDRDRLKPSPGRWLKSRENRNSQRLKGRHPGWIDIRVRAQRVNPTRNRERRGIDRGYVVEGRRTEQQRSGIAFIGRPRREVPAAAPLRQAQQSLHTVRALQGKCAALTWKSSSLAPRCHAPHSAELKRFSCGFRRVRQLPVFPRRPGARVAHLVWAGRENRRISAPIHENNKAHFSRTVKIATRSLQKNIFRFLPRPYPMFFCLSAVETTTWSGLVILSVQWANGNQ